MKLNRAGLFSVAGLILAAFFAIVGAMLPWADTAFGISKAGVEGDGIITFVAGIILLGIAGFRLATQGNSRSKWSLVVVGSLLSILVFAVGVFDIADVNSVAEESSFPVKVGSGLYVTVVAGALGICACLLGAFSGTALSQPAPADGQVPAIPRPPAAPPSRGGVAGWLGKKSLRIGAGAFIVVALLALGFVGGRGVGVSRKRSLSNGEANDG